MFFRHIYCENYCSDLHMFLIRLNHLIAVLAIFETTALTQQNVNTLSWQLPGATSTVSFCKAQSKFYGSHFEFNFFLDLVEAPTFFSTGVVSAKGYAHGYLIFSFCTFSFVLNFHVFSFCTHVITQTQDIMTGVLVGNDEIKIQNTKGGKKKESLQKGCLKISETGKKRKTISCCLTK